MTDGHENLNSFHNWKKQDIQILKGSKAYKVNVPIFSKRQEESSAEDKVLSYFKLGNVFDISSTSEYEKYLKEQEEIDEKIMKNHEINYELALTHLKTNYPEIRITEDFKHQDKKGSYDPHSKHITLYEHSSHTIFHELGHYLTIEVLKIAGDIHKDYAKNEVLAEIFSYLLMRSFDENVNYNFAYSNCWASRITDAFEIEEFEHAFKAITNYLTKFQEKGEANA